MIYVCVLRPLAAAALVLSLAYVVVAMPLGDRPPAEPREAASVAVDTLVERLAAYIQENDSLLPPCVATDLKKMIFDFNRSTEQSSAKSAMAKILDPSPGGTIQASLPVSV